MVRVSMLPGMVNEPVKSPVKTRVVKSAATAVDAGVVAADGEGGEAAVDVQVSAEVAGDGRA